MGEQRLGRSIPHEQVFRRSDQVSVMRLSLPILKREIVRADQYKIVIAVNDLAAHIYLVKIIKALAVKTYRFRRYFGCIAADAKQWRCG